ncbi:MAG: aldo/keto reductase [Chloroflexi bacterium]|nr:aldo/keto reductase [Chloroflexota bacterium]
MEYVNFGKAGVKVSRLALGMGLRGQADESAAQRMVERAIELGINLIDCANVYGLMDDRGYAGRSEIILGRALKGRRDDVVITSKVHSPVGQGPNDRGSSRYHIMREVERSLRRLDTDHIDVYLLHNVDPTTPLEETVRALDDLVRQGKVLYVGCCNFAAWQVCKALWIAERINAAPFICVQNPYSLLDRRLEGEMFGFVRDQGLGVMAYSPLGVGLLSGAYMPGQPPPQGSLWATRRRDVFSQTMSGQVAEVVKALRESASELGKTPAQVALAWVLSHPEVTVAILGGDNIEHLEDNVGAVGWQLPAEIRARLDEVSAAMTQVLN